MRPTRLRHRLIVSTALATGLALAAPQARAQTPPPTPPALRLPTAADVVGSTGIGTPVLSQNDTRLDIGVTANGAMVDWKQFDIPTAQSIHFNDETGGGGSAVAVLNRIVGDNGTIAPSTIDGLLQAPANMAVFLVNSAGITFGPNGVVDVGSLVAGTVDLSQAAFTAGLATGNYRFAGGGTGVLRVNAGSSITATGSAAAGLGNVVLLGAKLAVDAPAPGGVAASILAQQGAVAGADDGDVALVAADDVTIAASAGSPLAITIAKGTAVEGAFKVDGTIAGRNVTLALATRGGVADTLLSVRGMTTATGAALTDRGVVLTADRASGDAVTLAPALASDISGTGGINIAATIGSGAALTVAAATAATVGGPVAVGGDYAVTGGSVTLGAAGTAVTQQANGAVTITGGPLTGLTGLTLRSDSAGATGGALTLAGSGAIAFGGTTLAAGNATDRPAVQIHSASATDAVTLGTVRAGSLLGAVADDAFATGIVRDAAITVGDVTLAGAPAGTDATLRLDAGSAALTTGLLVAPTIDLASGGLLTLGGIAGTGAVTLSGAGDLAARTIAGVSSLTIDRSGSVTLTDVTASGDVLIGQTPAARPTTVTATGALTSTAGAIRIAGSGLLTLATVDAAGNATLGGVGLTATALTAGDLAVTSTGSGVVSIGAITTTAGDAGVLGGAAVTVAGAVSAEGLYRVTGTSVALGTAGVATTQAATGAVSIEATGGDVTGRAGLILRSDRNGTGAAPLTLATTGAGGGTIDFTGTTLQGGPARQSAVRIAPGSSSSVVVTLGNVSANALQGDQLGSTYVDGITRDTTLTFGTLDLAGALVATSTNGDIRLAGVTVGQGIALSAANGALVLPATLSAPGSIALTTGRDLTLGTVTSTGGGVSIATGGRALAATVLDGATGLTVTAGSGAVALGRGRAGSGTLSITAGLLGGNPASTGVDLSADGAVTLDLTGAALLGTVTGGSIGVTGSGRIDLASASASGNVALAAGGALAFGTVTAGTGGTGTVGLTAGGTLSGTGATGVGTVVAQGLDADIGSLGSSAGAVSLVTTGGNARLGTASAATSVSVTATGGAASVTGAVDAGGDYTIGGTGVTLGNGAVAVVQSARGAVGVTATNGTLTAGSGLTLRANADDSGAEALTLATTGTTGGDIAFAGAVQAGTTPSAGSALVIRSRDAANAVTLGDIVAQGLIGAAGNSGDAPGLRRSGAIRLGAVTLAQALIVEGGSTVDTGAVTASEIALTAQGALTATGLTAFAGPVVLAGTGVTAVTGAIRATGTPGDIRIDRTGAIRLTDLNATRDISIGGAGIVPTTLDVTGTTVAGRDLSVTSTGAQSYAGAVTAGHDATLSGSALTLASGIVATTGALSLTTTAGDLVLPTLTAGTDATLVAAGAVRVSGTTLVGRDLSVTSTGAQSYGGTVTAGRDATLSGSTLTLTGGIVATTGALSLTATAGDLVLPTLTAGTDATLVAAGAVRMSGTTLVGRDLSVTSTGAQSYGGAVTAGRDATLSGSTLTLTGGIAATTGALSLTATAGDLVLPTLNAGTDATLVAAGAVRVSGGVDLPGDYTVTGGSVTLGTTGTAVVQRARGAVTVTATGGTLTGLAGLTLQSDSAGATGGVLTLAGNGAISFAGTTLVAGVGAIRPALRIRSARASDTVTLGTVRAGSLLGATGSDAFATGIVRDAAISVGDVTLAGAPAGTDATLRLDAGSATLTTGLLVAPAIDLASGGLLSLGGIGGAGAVRLSGAGDLAAGTIAGIGSLTIDRGGSVTLADVTASGDVLIGQTPALRPTTITATGPLTSTAGAIRIAGSGAQSYAGAVGARGAAILDGGSIVAGAVTSATGAVRLTAADTVTLATASSAGDTVVTGGGLVRVTGAVDSGADYRVAGSGVVLGSGNVAVTQAATGSVRIVSTAGTIAGGAGLTLQGDRAGSGLGTLVLDGAGGIALDPATVLRGGTGDIGVRTVGSAGIALGIVDARRLTGADAAGALTATLAAGGTLDFAGTVTTVRTLEASAAGTLTARRIAVTGTGGDLILTTTGAGADLAARGVLTATRDVRLTAGRDLAFTDVTAGGAVAATAGGALSGTTLTGTTVRAVATAALSIATLSGQSGVEARGGTVTLDRADSATGPLSLAATTGGLTASRVTAGGSVLLSARGAIALDQGSAGGDLTIADATDIGGIATGTRTLLTAGRDVTVTARGTVRGATFEAGRDLAVTAGSIDLLAGIARSGTATFTATTGTATTGTVTIGTLTGGPITITTAGDAVFDRIDAAGRLTIAAGGTLTANSLTATGAIDARGTSATIGRTTGGDTVALRATTGDLTLATVTGATGVGLIAGRDTQAGSVTATGAGADLSIATGRLDGGAGVRTILTAGRDLTVSARGAVLAGPVVAGRQAGLRAASLDLSGVTAAGASIAATGDAVAGSLTVTGALDYAAGGLARVGTIDAGGLVTVDAGTVELTTVQGGDGVRATSRTGPLTIVGLSTRRDVDLRAATDAVLGRIASSEGRIDITAGGLLGATALAARTTIAGSGAGVAIGTAEAGDIALTARSGALSIASVTAGNAATLVQRGAGALTVTGAVTAGGDATLASDGALTAPAITAGRDLRVTAGGAARLAALTAGRAIDVTAGGQAAVTGAVTAASYAVQGADVILGTTGRAVTQQASGAVTVRATQGGIVGAGGLTLTSDSDGDGVGDLTLRSAGAIGFAGNTRLLAGADGSSTIRLALGTAAPLDLDVVRARTIVSAGAGATRFAHDGAVSIADLLVRDATTIALTGATTPLTLGTARALGALTLTTTGALTAGTLGVTDALVARGGSVALATTDAGSADIASTAGPLDLARLTVRGAAVLDAAGTIGFERIATGGALTIGATGDILGRGDATLASSAGAVTIATRESGDTGGLVRLATATAATDLSVTARRIELTTARATTGAATLVARGTAPALTAGRVEAGGGVLLSVAGGTIRLGSAEARGGTLRVTADGDLTGLDATTGTALTATGGIDATIGRTARIDAARAGGDLRLVTGDLRLGTGSATGVASLTAGGAATIGSIAADSIEAVARTGPLDVTTARAGTGLSLTSAGDLSLVDGIAGGTATITATGTARVAQMQAAAATIRGNVLLLDRITTTAALTATAGSGGATLGTIATGTSASFTSGGALAIGSVTAGGAIVATAAGALGADSLSSGAATEVTAQATTLRTVRAGTTLAVTNGSGALAIGQATAGATARITSTGDARIDALTAAQDVAFTGRGNARFGTLASTGGAVVLASTGDLTATSLASARALTVTGRSVAAATVAAGSGLVATATGGDLSLGTLTAATTAITATGEARIDGAVSVAGEHVVRGATVTLGTAGTAVVQRAGTVGLTATGGAITGRGALALSAGTGGMTLTATGAGGAIDLAAASALDSGAGLAIETAGTATLASVTNSGRTVAISATDLVLNGPVTGGTIMLTNRTPANPTRLGDAPAANAAEFANGSARFDLSTAEIGRLTAANLIVDAGSGAVTVGDVTLGTAAGSTTFQIRTGGRIDLLGRFVASGSPAVRTIVLGGGATPETRARTLRVATTSAGGGRLIVGDATLDLRADAIGVGMDTGFLDAIGVRGGTPATDVATRYVAQSNSALYNATVASPAGFYTDPVTVQAGRLIVRYGGFALFQNTGTSGTTGGVVLGGAGQTQTLQLLAAAPANAAALFGTVNGIGGTATSLLGSATLVVGDQVSRADSRANGCLIGSVGGGCLTASLAQPTLNIFDSSRLDVFRTSDDLTLPFDPLISTSNEALFSDIADVGLLTTDATCPADGSVACPPATEQR